MLLAFIPIFAVLAFLLFFVFIFFTKGDKNKLYIKYVLLAYPLIATTIIPGGTGINNFDLITWIFYLFFYRPKKTEIKGGMLYLVLFFIIIIGGGIACYQAKSLTIETFRTFEEIFAIFMFAKILTDECISDSKFFYEVIEYLKITVLVSLAFLACQFVLGVQFSLARSQNPNVLADDGTRYPSFFQDPQKYAQFLAAGSFLFLIKSWDTIKLPLKNYGFLVLCLIGLLWTGGRAGLGGWALGFSLIVLFGNPAYKIYALMIGLAMFVLIYNFQDSFSVFKRGDSLSDSYDFRFSIWLDAYGIFLDNPFFGIAPGNYANYVSVHNPDQYWFLDNEITYYDHPESGYLKLLTEHGGIGFIAIMLLVIVPMIKSFFSYLKWKDTTFLLLISSVISWMMGFYTVYSFGDVRIQIWIVTIICLLITAYKRFEPDDAEEQEEYAE